MLKSDTFGPGTYKMLLDEVNCGGDERSLADCGHNAWGEHNCEHDENTAIKCVDSLTIEGHLKHACRVFTFLPKLSSLYA